MATAGGAEAGEDVRWMEGDATAAADGVPVPKTDMPLDMGTEGEEPEETPANKLLARLVLFVSIFGNSDSLGFGGAIRSKTGVDELAGIELFVGVAENPEVKDEGFWLELPNTDDETTGAGAI